MLEIFYSTAEVSLHFFVRFGMGIEFREGSLVINSKNQYKLKKGEFQMHAIGNF